MPALMRPNPVRANLQAGGNVYGTMAFEFFSPGLMAILAEAGADFVLLDTEHSGVGIETLDGPRTWDSRSRFLRCNPAGFDIGSDRRRNG